MHDIDQEQVSSHHLLPSNDPLTARNMYLELPVSMDTERYGQGDDLEVPNSVSLLTKPFKFTPRRPRIHHPASSRMKWARASRRPFCETLEPAESVGSCQSRGGGAGHGTNQKRKCVNNHGRPLGLGLPAVSGQWSVEHDLYKLWVSVYMNYYCCK